MKTLLLFGFEPFAGDTVNPSGEIARRLDGRVIAGHRVTGAVLPCAFGASVADLRRLLRRHRPSLVIGLGLAAGRAAITPERVAINVDDARIADNAGACPVDRPVVRGGPAAYWSTLPIKAIVAALRREGLPAAVSQTAGTFVCNHAFYGLMHALARRHGVRGGFVHVPAIPELARRGQPRLSLARMIRATEIIVTVAAKRKADLKRADGAIG